MMIKYDIKMPSETARWIWVGILGFVTQRTTTLSMEETGHFSGGSIYISSLSVAFLSMGIIFLVSSLIRYGTKDEPVILHLIFRPFLYFTATFFIPKVLVEVLATLIASDPKFPEATADLRMQYADMAASSCVLAIFYLLILGTAFRVVHFAWLRLRR